MKVYSFKIFYKNEEDENVWVRASDKLDAISQLKDEYPGIVCYYLLSVKDSVED